MAMMKVAVGGLAGFVRQARAMRLAGCVFGATALAPGLVAAETVTVDPPAAGEAAKTDPAAKDEALVYIFSGALTGGGETYSGTLVAAADGPQFELKLGKGATCDGSKLEPDKGLLRLPETPCSDGRPLKALFVYQQGNVLRVYGSVGAERFSTEAHALPSDGDKSTSPAAK